MLYAGVRASHGRGGLKEDEGMALNMFRKAAETDWPQAQILLFKELMGRAKLDKVHPYMR